MKFPEPETTKQQLLNAAAEILAQKGLQVSLAAISKAANLPESTGRRLFPRKQLFLDELFLHLYRQRISALMENYDNQQALEQRAQAMWSSHIDWAVQNQSQEKTLNLLNIADLPTEAARKFEAILFPDPEIAEVYAANEIFEDRNPCFADAILAAIVDTTIQFIQREPEKTKEYKLSGFQAIQRILLT